MTINVKNPAALAGAYRVRNSIGLASIYPETTTNPLEIQRLRAISRRVPLSPTVAAIVAQMAYGEGASWR